MSNNINPQAFAELFGMAMHDGIKSMKETLQNARILAFHPIVSYFKMLNGEFVEGKYKSWADFPKLDYANLFSEEDKENIQLAYRGYQLAQYYAHQTWQQSAFEKITAEYKEFCELFKSIIKVEMSPLEKEERKNEAMIHRNNFVTKYKRVKRMNAEDRLQYIVKAFEKYPDLFKAGIEQDGNITVIMVRPANEDAKKVFNSYTCGNLYGISLYDDESENDKLGYGMFIAQADCDPSFDDDYFNRLFSMPVGDGSERLGWGYADITTRTIASFVDYLYHELMYNGDISVTD